ncbi:MAG: ferrochelatase [Parvibaculales bacterium]
MKTANHPPIKFGKMGLLLVNLGTPNSPDAKGVRPYLKEFLSDRRVIELSSFIWQPILRGLVLNVRPRKSAKAYAKIWRKESNESPLRYYTRQQAEKLQNLLDDDASNKLSNQVIVDWAMRYGSPSIEEKLDVLRQAGCERIAVLALYPQYSATSSASVYDSVFRALMKLRWQPAIRTASAWHDDPTYIEVLAQSAEAHLKGLDWQPEILLASFHGLPQAYFDKGDPYHCQCAKTARLLREKLGLAESDFRLVFQSRFGATKWLEPYADKMVTQLAQSGIKRIAVITPGFISDCVETLEEIDLALNAIFRQNGGTHFTTIPCLNDSAGGLHLLEKLARRELAGWLNSASHS